MTKNELTLQATATNEKDRHVNTFAEHSTEDQHGYPDGGWHAWSVLVGCFCVFFAALLRCAGDDELAGRLPSLALNIILFSCQRWLIQQSSKAPFTISVR